MKKLYYLLTLFLACMMCACHSDEPRVYDNTAVTYEIDIDGGIYSTHNEFDDEGNRIFHCLYYYYKGVTYMRLIVFENSENIFEHGQYIINLVMPGKIGNYATESDLTPVLIFDTMTYIPNMVSSYIYAPDFVLNPHAGKITLVAVNKNKVVLHFDEVAFYTYFNNPNDLDEHHINGEVGFYGPEDPKALWPDEDW